MRRDTEGARAFQSRRRTPINKVSAKQTKKNAEWLIVRAEVLLRDPHCQLFCVNHQPCYKPSVDAHHVQTRGRGGKDTLDNLIGLCRKHHDWVHDNGVAAEKLGLLKHGWDD
jgi:5-methylcytosine-specific restriction endonuclease McrA